MPKRTRDHDSWQMQKLGDPDLAARYLTAVLQETPERFLVALGDVARAYQMTRLADETGVTRESLYRALSIEGNPTFETLKQVFKALNLKIDKIAVASASTPASGFEPSPAIRVPIVQEGIPRQVLDVPIKVSGEIALNPAFNLSSNAATMSDAFAYSTFSSNTLGIEPAIPNGELKSEREPWLNSAQVNASYLAYINTTKDRAAIRI